MSEAMFRVGGFYRQRNGCVAQLSEHRNGELAIANTVWYPERGLNGHGLRRLNNGLHVRPNEESRDPNIDLLPGELHNVNGEWLPLEQRPALSLGAILRAKMQEMQAKATSAAKPVSKTPTLDALANVADPKRAPLPHYGQRTAFDNFREFTVSSDCAVEAQPDGALGGLRLDGCVQFKTPRAM